MTVLYLETSGYFFYDNKLHSVTLLCIQINLLSVRRFLNNYQQLRPVMLTCGVISLIIQYHTTLCVSISGMGDQLFFPLCFITFTSNKTQLTEFPESKSDMPFFLRVLALK